MVEKARALEQQVTRAGFVYDFGREKTFSLKNTDELRESIKKLPAHFELSSAGESLLVDITHDEEGFRAETRPLSKFRMNGQTPRLHDDAFTLLTQVSNVMGELINWHLETEDEEVILWAQSPQSVMGTSGWDSEKFSTETRLEAVKRIEPLPNPSAMQQG